MTCNATVWRTPSILARCERDHGHDGQHLDTRWKPFHWNDGDRPDAKDHE